ncbi:hypothetical protein [Paenibacillus sp. F4]|nr:hypothetical protein [Paenibacillus sp. F4]
MKLRSNGTVWSWMHIMQVRYSLDSKPVLNSTSAKKSSPEKI